VGDQRRLRLRPRRSPLLCPLDVALGQGQYPDDLQQQGRRRTH
jgi:hypothetical protein